MLIDIGQALYQFQTKYAELQQQERFRYFESDYKALVEQAVDYALDKIEHGRSDYSHLIKMVSFNHTALQAEFSQVVYVRSLTKLGNEGVLTFNNAGAKLNHLFNDLVMELHCLISITFTTNCPQYSNSATVQFPFERRSIVGDVLVLEKSAAFDWS